MQLADFRAMVLRMADEIPPQYLEGIAGIEISPRTIPHPERTGVYTLGECIPVDVGGEDPPSRIVLYHGSFQALAVMQNGFDWRGEAWETLTHEVRHHLEWRARTQDLEEYDWAADQEFARAEAEPFDPLFYLSGEQVAAGRYRVDDALFIDLVVRQVPPHADLDWEGRRYRVAIPREPLPLYLRVDGLPGPEGEQVTLVVRHAPRLRDLFRKRQPVTEREVRAEPLAAAG